MRKQINARLQNLEAYCDTAVRAYALLVHSSAEKKAERSTKLSGRLMHQIEDKVLRMSDKIKPLHTMRGAISKMRWVK